MAQQPPTLAKTGQSNQPRSHSGPTTAAGQRAMQNAAKSRSKSSKPPATTTKPGAPAGGASAAWKAYLSNPANAAAFGQAFAKAYQPPAPFLTPTQQAALNNWNTKYAGDIADLTQKDTGAVAKYNAGVSADTLRNSQQTDMTNQSMAARGMFTSSIRDGALNDLAVTLQQQLNVLQTNEHATLLADQTARNTLAGENANTQTFYDSAAAANAAALPPNTNLPPIHAPSPTPPPNQPHPNPGGNGITTGAAGTGGTGAPYVGGTRTPGGTRPPSLTSQSNQPNSHSGPTGAGLNIHAPGMTGAARLRAGGGTPYGGVRAPGTGLTKGGG